MDRASARSAVTLILTLIPVLGLCQIPNAGFENWTEGFPDGWLVNNLSPVYLTIRPTDASHTGSYAALGTVVWSTMGVVAPILQSGPNGEGFAYSQRPTSLRGWYRYTPLGGDLFVIDARLYKNGANGTLVATAETTDSNGNYWGYFTALFDYKTDDFPDTAVVTFMIVGPGTGPDALPHAGSWFTVDDLSFIGGTAVPIDTDALPVRCVLEQNYPNPFNPTTRIKYTIGGVREQGPGASNTRLVVYDLLGREVAVLVNEKKLPGTYEVQFDAGLLASGVYFYRLQAGSFIDTRKMLLIR